MVIQCFRLTLAPSLQLRGRTTELPRSDFNRLVIRFTGIPYKHAKKGNEKFGDSRNMHKNAGPFDPVYGKMKLFLLFNFIIFRVFNVLQILVEDVSSDEYYQNRF
jgi:hypothetical protein